MVLVHRLKRGAQVGACFEASKRVPERLTIRRLNWPYAPNVQVDLGGGIHPKTALPLHA
jgi:hypothetical protein